ncbi:cation:proton antiporter, partial [Kitasatospora sp. NPDC093558]|uniref:cation:proton antiporter n=1 Tax=Kitasatospora sp. NPDC093558 TaxID=3155201 RepID=UPI0034191C90
MEGSSPSATVLADIAAVLLIGLLLTPLRTRLRQPVVVGEIAVGVILGPSVLGLLTGHLTDALFPPDVRSHLSVVAQLGIALFMFAAGWELDLRLLSGRVRTVLTVTAASVLVPFAPALVLAAVVAARFPWLLGAAASPWLFAAFLGIALSASALSVLARIVAENQLQATGTGAMATACGALTEITAWCAVVCLAAAARGAGAPGSGRALLTLAEVACYAVAMAFVVRPLLRRLLRLPAGAGGHPLLALLTVGSGLLLSAWVTSRLGVHAVIGAFAFGLAMPRDAAEELRHTVELPLRHAGALLVPVFFALTGLSVDLTGLGPRGLLAVAVFLTVSWGGKYVGARLGARLTGLPPGEATAVAVLVNTKGLSEILILTLGRDLGIIGDRLFTVLLMTALAATLPVNPLVRRLTRTPRTPGSLPRRPHALAGPQP